MKSNKNSNHVSLNNVAPDNDLVFEVIDENVIELPSDVEAWLQNEAAAIETCEPKRHLKLRKRVALNPDNGKSFRISSAEKRRRTAAIESRMNSRIPRVFVVEMYNPIDNSWSPVGIPQSALLRYLLHRGYSEDDVKIGFGAVGQLKMNAESLAAKARHEDTVNDGIIRNGKHYKLLMANASQIKDAKYFMVSDRCYQDVLRFIMNGFSMEGCKIAPNKAHAYRGLTTSSSYPFREVFGHNIDISRVVIVPDRYKKLDAVVDYVKGQQVTLHTKRTINVNVCDGLGLILPWLCKNEFFSLRASAAGVKAGCLPVDFRLFAKDRGITKIKDIWGKDHDIDKVDMILFESAFKFAKYVDSWEHWCRNWKHFGHHFCVCVREHPATPKPTCYQMLQTLTEGVPYVDIFAAQTIVKMNEYSLPENAVYLVPRAAQPVFASYPALFNTLYGRFTVQQSYKTKRDKASACRIPGIMRNSFVAPDPLAALEAAFGLPIKGVLRAGQCSCTAGKQGPTDIVRYPHLAHEHIILNNVRMRNRYFVDGPTMYLNVHDLTIVRLRGDYDGDHVAWSQYDILLSLVMMTDDRLGNVAVDWDAPESEKVYLNDYEYKKFIVNNVNPSPIGLIANDQTRLFNHLYKETVIGRHYHWDEVIRIMAEGQMMGNVKIDASKHGDLDLEASPLYVDAISYGTNVVTYRNGKEVASKFFKNNADALDYAQELRDKMAGVHGCRIAAEPAKYELPEVIRFAKADREHPVEDDKYWNNRVHYTDSFVDRLSRKIREEIPEQLKIEGIENQSFNAFMLQFVPHRPIGRMTGLWNVGTKVPGTEDEYTNRGFFNELAARNTAMWKAMDLKGSLVADWDAGCGRIAREEVRRWAEAHGGTLEEAYDTIVIKIFGMGKRAFETSMMGSMLFRLFWNAFGDLALQALQQNLANREEESSMGVTYDPEIDPCCDDADEAQLSDEE